MTLERIAFERDDTIGDAVRQNSNLAIALEEQTVRALKGVDQALLFVRREHETHKGELDLAQLVASGDIDASNFTNLGLVDEHGDPEHTLLAGRLVNLADRDWFRVHQAADTRRMYVGVPVDGRLTGIPAVILSRRVNRPDSSFGGVVFGAVSPSYFTNLYSRANLGANSEIQLVGLDGIARARRVNDKSTFGEDMSRTTLLASQAKNPIGNFLSLGRVDGVKRFISYRTLPQYPLVVSVGTSEDESLAGFRQHERNYYLGAGLATLFGVIFSAALNASLRRQRHGFDALAGSEATYRATFDHANVGIAQASLDSRLRKVNPRLCEMLGYTEPELLSVTFLDITHPDDRAASGDLRDRLVTAQPGSPALALEKRYLRKDGSALWALVTGALLRNAYGTPEHVLVVIQDITERKHAEESLRESEQRFRAMLEQSIAAVYMIQDGKVVYGNPRMHEIFGYAPEEQVDPDPLAHIAPHERARVAEQMARRLSDEPIAAYSVAAVRKDGTPFTLGVHAKRASFDGKPAIIAIAQDITEKARDEEEIKHYVTRLEQAIQSTINVVATIGELRDPYTHGHERRVGEIAAEIAAEMGLDANRVEGIRVAGYLHDVGKIGVPAEILAKPARLTKAEFDLVRDHAQRSYEILKGVEFPWPVAEAAWEHHERVDGSGYPRGLKGDEIILEARILAVADTVEAMSSHRPYRPGLGIEAALEEISRNRGKLYDAAAVDACVRLFREKHFTLPK